MGRREGRQHPGPMNCLNFLVPCAVTPLPPLPRGPRSTFCAPALQAAHKDPAVHLSLATSAPVLRADNYSPLPGWPYTKHLMYIVICNSYHL